ncbi:chromosome segregation protein SMC [Streptococcus parauberis]|uniref:chromosome segregation protein SMC n=1 Tax=Streptococcus parauberis TaxID=1348 RepID=UPI000789ABC0|nr:chromosome segregation protein SMC [Streptococcus parauberis]KYP17598.1 Chromosome partition protein Smc [Streptococcus parauberis]KYP18747.1 Chromosome partition protein Smc [Streptococcus parauberis]KYP20149.1 Chromosome partition protein Smc [Streptococcus parauberis]KYP24325.1 Chromosome partition protein Smc [Streptococcus parauberis]KYP26437.1 Chromosome partition protein Smc [Streptococcus parauberis]
MFLRRIEMQGFKSFADKTKIEFDKGVTAVVGPNGSGKSNVTESLRWALGESSAKSLRGGKMPDIIFAGTESRNALNFAEVAVILDNSDQFIKDANKEIRVERHIYRNGDSDYLIDGKKVRLRDIHDLFMDTGLGKDSFSIISQGRVEEIFNSKAEERRAIFEEAAGVLKYKTRKKETESKLNQTQDNLDRLDDIVYELETQITPLEKQAKTAKEFILLDEDRSQLQLDILVSDIALDKVLLTTKEEELSAIKQDMTAYHQHREKLENENQSLKTKRQTVAQEMDLKQGQLLELTKALSDLERQIELIKLEKSQKSEKKEEASSRIKQLKEELLTLQNQESEKTLGLENVSVQLSQLSQEVVRLTEEMARFSTDPDQVIEDLREDYVKLMQDEADISNKLSLLVANIEQEKLTKANQDKEYQETSQKVDLLIVEKKQAFEEFQASQQEVAKLLKNYQDLDQKVGQEQGNYQLAQSKLFDILDQKKAKEARQTSLESIQRSHSQFYAGVRAVLQNAKQIGGILGAVSEHLNFDKDYQTAMEVALGASSQHIIVENEVSAKNAIAYLKQNRQGRATFLPLTTIKARYLADNFQKQLETSPGFIGTAQSLVSYDSKLDAIIKNLLNVTAIFDTIDHANSAAKKLNYKVRIVTLDGTELRPGGSFSGGANRQSNSTFIQPELDQVSAELLAINQDLKNQEKVVAGLLQQLQAKQAQLEEFKTRGEQARLAEQKANLFYQQVKELFEDASALLEVLDTNDQTSQLAKNQDEKLILEEKLVELAKQKEKLNLDIDDIKSNKDAIADKKNQIMEDLSQKRLKERDLLNEQRFERSNLESLVNRIQSTQDHISQQEDLLTLHVSQEHIDQLPSLETKLVKLAESKQGVEERLVQLRFENEDYAALLEELEDSLTKLQFQNEDFIRKQTKLEAEVEQVSDRLRSHAKALVEDFQMTLEDAQKDCRAVEDANLAKENLKQLQKKIKQLGPINLDAIEQYDEVAERLEFLNTQKADLNRAKDMLLGTIGNMDNEVKARFKVTFEAIRESFKETFSQMFGGGTADLVLTDGDLLTAGVEISVQPPGKKIQSLNLMSGGEKALSALALLFAIIRVKTIPFVILDEVEAALDEANVKRFGDYLNRFDKNSQFIVVTHRKGTMAAADSIYGITMQESGVSKVVSVKLKESENLGFLS